MSADQRATWITNNTKSKEYAALSSEYNRNQKLKLQYPSFLKFVLSKTRIDDNLGYSGFYTDSGDKTKDMIFNKPAVVIMTAETTDQTIIKEEAKVLGILDQIETSSVKRDVSKQITRY